MFRAQTAIFTQGSTQHYFLEYTLTNNSDLIALRMALKEIYSASSSCPTLIAFSNHLWQRLSNNDSSFEFNDFQSLLGPFGHQAIATQHDLLIWIHSDNQSVVCDMLQHVHDQLAEHLTLELECPAFTYQDQRDLTGFIDGSANPQTLSEQQAISLIPQSENEAAGSFVLTQKWCHKLDKFKQLPLHCQEKIIGRTKDESIELEGDEMPANSHVSRTDVKVDNVAMKIYRRSAPFVSANQRGLYFIAFSCHQARFQVQLERMFGLTEDGLYDKLIDYSEAINSAYWFAPSQNSLEYLFNTE